MDKTINLKKISHYMILGLLCVISVFPVLFVVIGMTHSSGFAFNTLSKLSFGNNLALNYQVLNLNFDIGNVIMNSIFVSSMNSLIGISIIYMSAYAFAKYDFKGKKILFLVLVLSMMVPGNVIIINKFRVISILGLKNSFAGLILPTLVNIHVLLLLIKNFEFLENDVIEAARIDGASELRIVFQIGLPSVFGYVVLGMFNLFLRSWNNFLLPLLTVTTEKYFTLPIMISSIADPLRFKFGAVFLGMFILILPTTILLLSMSKYMFRKVN